LSLPWYKVWLRALRPSVKVYEETLASQNNVTLKTAITWSVVSVPVGYLIGFTQTYLLRQVDPAVTETLLCLGTPMAALGGVFQLMFLAGIGNWIARLLGGKGRLAQIAYSYAALQSPLFILANAVYFVLSQVAVMVGLVSGIAIWILATVLFALCHLVLSIVAVRAVYQFGWGKTLVVTLPVLVTDILILAGSLSIVYFSDFLIS
jgi:hypothetical protein